MESPNRNAPEGRQAGFDRELIEREIAHLKKGKSVRYAHEESRHFSRGLMLLAIVAVLWIYCMDPFLYAYYRGDAIRTYLYLHNYGDDRKAAALAASGYFPSMEIQQLNNRTGSFQDYFNGTEAAEKKSADLIRYMQGVRDLHHDNYAALTPLNKFRYIVFVKTGITPPERWDFLNPSIGIK